MSAAAVRQRTSTEAGCSGDAAVGGGERTDGRECPTTADLLQALASPARLAILKALRRPRRLCDIQVTPDGQTPLSRQAVRRHLDMLIEQGLARLVPEAEGAGQYVLDHEGLFDAVDHVRRLAPAPAPEGGEDTVMDPHPEGTRAEAASASAPRPQPG